MRSKFLPFSRPSINQDDITAVEDILRSGWITTGPKAAEFERRFCEYVGCVGAVALSSATAGMHLLFRALGIGKGDEIITPSMTWVSTVNLILLSGATPVFADIDRNTLMITSDSINKCLSKRTRLIIPVHFAGSPADMKPIQQIADKKDIFVVEDAAQALGTQYNDKNIGASGTSIFSFHPTKNITTGEGGMFCSDDRHLLDRIRRLKFHGLGVDAYDRHQHGRSPQAEVVEPGYKYNMPDISAALGISQLSRIEKFIKRRSELVERYHQRLSEVDEILPLSDPPYAIRHSLHLFVVRLDIDRVTFGRDHFMQELKQKNIGTGLHFKAVHLQKYYRKLLPIPMGLLSNTEWNSNRILSLPLFFEMTPGDVDDVVDAIKEILVR
jgi:UDP-4-amino-4-deoxy-L-arabinose-oxoglutarate aminotransferase